MNVSLLRSVNRIPIGVIWKRYSSVNTVKTKTTFQLSRTFSGENTPIGTPGEVELKNAPYDLHRIDKSPSVTSEISKEEGLELYKQMQTIRKMETTAASMYQSRQIRGFCHVYVGEEACAVGIKSVMRPQDTVITSYRCHGWAYMMGETVEAILSELLGRVGGSSRAKGGSMHIYGEQFFGGNGIVGAHVPLGTGIALAHKYVNKGAISFTIYGDGAVDQGQIYESYNFAKLHDLPICYIIENNNYSMGTSTVRHSANPNYYTRGDMVPGIRVGGMDILAVREAGKFAIDFIKKGNGPIILQLDTYRYFGHSMSDPGTSYRSREEIKSVRQSNDSIKNFMEKLISTKLVEEEELKKIEKQVKEEVDKFAAKAVAQKEPAAEELHCDVYADYKGKFRLPKWSTWGQHKNVSNFYKKPV